MTASRRNTLTLIGGGLDFSANLSAEACRAIRSAAVVCHPSCPPAVVRWLADFARQARLVDIDEGFYRTGQYRPDMYRAMAARVVELVRTAGDTVLLEPGSAKVTDLVSVFLVDAARDAGIATRIVPGISSLEHLFIAFDLDPSTGVQAILAQELVAQRLRLNPQMHSILIQPGYYDTLWCAGLPRSRPDRFELLRQTLAASFGEDQPMALVRFAMEPDDIPHIFWFRLKDWHRTVPLITPLHTLFVPAAAEPPRDPGFMERIHDWHGTTAFMECDASGQPLQAPAVHSNRELQAMADTLDPALLDQARSLDRAWRESAFRRNAGRLSWSGSKP